MLRVAPKSLALVQNDAIDPKPLLIATPEFDPPFRSLDVLGYDAVAGANRQGGHTRRGEFIAPLGTSALPWTLPAKAHSKAVRPRHRLDASVAGNATRAFGALR